MIGVTTNLKVFVDESRLNGMIYGNEIAVVFVKFLYVV